MSFSTLPDEIVKNVLSFVSDPASLLACERSCTMFLALLADDEMWRYCCTNEEKDDRLSYRESAFVYRIVERIKESKARGDDNVILDVFGGATAVADYVDELILDWDPPIGHDFYVRGDSLGVLVHTLQDYFVDLISTALGMACMIAGGQGDTTYPTICAYHLEILDYARLPYGVSRLEGIDPFAAWGPPAITIPYSIANEQELERRFKLVRRFADKAGAVKLTTEAMKRVGTQFAQLCSALMRDAIIELLDYQDRTFYRNPDTADDVDLFNIAPPPRVIQEHGHMQHVIVPRQICQSHVYRQHIKQGGSPPYADAEWIPREGSSAEVEQREAISAYFDDDVDSLRMDSFEESDANEALFPDEDSSHWSAADDEEEDFGWVEEEP